MKKKSKLLLTLIFFAVLVGLLIGLYYYKNYRLGGEKNPIIMAFVPSVNKEEMRKSAERFAELLSSETGYKIVGQVDDYYSGVREAMGNNKTHIGWLNTFNYLLTREKYQVEPGLLIVRQSAKEYKGQIVINNKSKIKTLEDLKEKKICWVDESSTSGYIMPRILLKKNNIDPDTDLGKIIFADSHTEVINKVYNNECDAGATYIDARDALLSTLPDVKEKVSILDETDPIPNDNVSFVKNFSQKKKEKIMAGLIKVVGTTEGNKLLGELTSGNALVEVNDLFYNNFRDVLQEADINITELAD